MPVELHPRDDHRARRGGRKRASKSGIAGGGSVASPDPLPKSQRRPTLLPTWEAVQVALKQRGLASASPWPQD
jgi:hypothetical protein